MATLEDWQPAVPSGHRLLAAAPLTGDWGFPESAPWLGGVLLGIAYPVGTSSFWVGLSLYVAAAVGIVVRILWWRRRHPPPTGMAAILDVRRGDGPVVLVTDAAILATNMRLSSRLTGRARPTATAGTLPGLVAVDVRGRLLLLTFADGSTACMRQRSPTKGAAERVAALAAPVLQRQSTMGVTTSR